MVGKAKLRLLVAWLQARKGASFPGSGTSANADTSDADTAAAAASAAAAAAAKDAAKAMSPQRWGSTIQYLYEGTVKLTAWVHGMFAHKLPVFKCMLMGMANAQIKGAKWEANWPDGVTH